MNITSSPRLDRRESAGLDHAAEFGSLLDTHGPCEDSDLADLIEQDGRWRLERGMACGMDRYRAAVSDLVARPISLDAAIDVSLRWLASRDGCSTPQEKHAECLLKSYPELAGPIRLAALLGNQLLSTSGITASSARKTVTLPCSIGPTLDDGRRRYELVRRLGFGSSGLVCEAIDHLLSDAGHAAKVAVKIIPVDPATSQRQAAEATKARRIDHSGVVRVLDRGLTDEGDLFLVYELVVGGDLQSWFEARQRSVDLRTAARLIAAIARGVQAAHSVGLVHCDLKPSNVLMAADDQPRVSDFGVAALTDAQFTGAGAVVSDLPIGNLAFAAPEQIRQNQASASPLVDIYALGGLLYHLTTGSLPNGTSPGEVVRTHDPKEGRTTPPSIRALRPQADERLDRVCARAMQPRQEDRYTTAEELASDLEAWLDRLPIRWMKQSWVSRTRLWIRRSPAFAALWAGCAALLVGGGFVSGYFEHQALTSSRQATRLQKRLYGAQHAIVKEMERVKQMKAKGVEPTDKDKVQMFEEILNAPARDRPPSTEDDEWSSR